MDFWLVAFTLVIFGPTLIMMMLSFPSEPSLLQASLTYQVIKIMAIGMGISLTALGAWIASNLILDMWKSRKQLITDRRNTLLNIIKDFDRSFQNLKQATQQKTKEVLLENFQSRLRNLCYDYPWNEEKRVRITEVLNYIPDRLSNDPNVNSYLLFLGFVIHRDKIHTIKLVREKFLVELENLYNDPQFETNPKPMNLLQELHEHCEEYMMKLIDDASSTSKWSDQRFQTSASSIEFWELKTKDKEAHFRVSRYILRRMDDAAQNKEDVVWKRLETLYAMAGR